MVLQATWFAALLTVVSLGLALVHLVRLLTARRDGRPAGGEAAHAAMGVGMAAMFSPFGDPVPAPAWAAVFLVSAAWFAVVALRSGSAIDDAGHHVVCGAAMVLMLLVAPASGGHGGHRGSAGAWASLVAVGLAGYFALHVMRCGDRVLAARPAVAPMPAVPSATATATATGTGTGTGTATGPGCAGVPATGPAGLRGPRAAAVAHLVTAGAMAAMLLATL